MLDGVNFNELNKLSNENIMSIENSEFKINKLKICGEGGSKTIIEIENTEFVLAIPNFIDFLEVLIKKWKKCLSEEKTVPILKKLNLFFFE